MSWIKRYRVIPFTLLTLWSLFLLFPFLWMLLATFKSDDQIFRPLPLFPSQWNGESWGVLLRGEKIPFVRQFANSIGVSLLQTLLAIGLTLPVGYFLSCILFRGKRVLFGLVFAILLVPQQAMAVPLFSWFVQLGWHDTFAALVLPGVVSGIGVLFFAQIYRKYPPILLDVARSEGANPYQVFRTTLPSLRPAIVTFGFLFFLLSWHAHLLPTIMIHSEEMKTVPLGLSSMLGAGKRFPYSLIMVGSFFAFVPTLVLFTMVRKNFNDTLSHLIES